MGSYRHTLVMATRVVEPDSPSIEKVERQLPTLPSSEAHRIRRAARSFADSMLPLAMRRLAEMLEAEDLDIAWKAVDRVLSMSLAKIPNETADPESVVVDGTSKSVDALKALEANTEKGTGLPDE